MVLFALACTALQPDDGPHGDALAAPAEDADLVTTPTADTEGTSPPPVPLIAEALAGRCPEPFPGEPFAEGTALHRVTLAGPGRCNDGSPPVLYVRGATDPAHANDWVWLFDGGSFCETYEECAVRWCGEHPPYGARDMSSNYAHPTRGGEGITSQAEWNAWRGWNHVFAAYCTSDQWRGTRGDYVFEGEPDYRLHFEGDLVAADGIATAVVGLVSDDQIEQLPLLADATTVIVAGVSAGSNGAALHRSKIAAAAPEAEVVTVLDSTFYAAPEVTDPGLIPVFESKHERLWAETSDPVWEGALIEACALDHPTEPWRCLNTETLMHQGYVEGTVLWQHDLRDPLSYQFFADEGITLAGYQQFGVDTARLFEDDVPAVSLFGYSCGIHTAIDGDATFSSFSVVDAENGGPVMTLHDALVSVLAGNRVVAVDSVPKTTSSCD